MSCWDVDELESQRRELEARRAMLEERFKLRLATAQEFGVIHAHRLGRVREAFAAQCGAARRRNQSILDRVQQSADAFSEERALSGLSRKRLSRQTERFLSAADKLYPAWQDQQLHSKANQLAAIEEERFVTEQRRKAARDSFEQEQALAAVIADRRRQLAAARARERNELAVRQVRRDRSKAEGGQALKAELELVKEAGRAARYEALAEATSHRLTKGYDNGSEKGDRSGSGDGSVFASQERRYVDIDDDDALEGEEEAFGVAERSERQRVRGDAESAVAATTEVDCVGMNAGFSGVRNEWRAEEECGADSQGRSRFAPGRRGGGRGVVRLDQHVLQDDFCAMRAEESIAADRVGGRATRKPARWSEEAPPDNEGRAEVAGSNRQSPPLAGRRNGQDDATAVATAKVEPGAQGARKASEKQRDKRRRDRRHRSRDNQPVDPSPVPPPPPPLGGSQSGGSSSGDDCAYIALGKSVEGKASNWKKKKNSAELDDLPRPPKNTSSSSPPAGRRGGSVQSFSSSDGPGGMDVSSEAAPSSLPRSWTTAPGRADVRERESRSGAAKVVAAGERGVTALRVPSWSEEDIDNDGGEETAEQKKKTPAGLGPKLFEFDEGVAEAVPGRDGGGSCKPKERASAVEECLPTTTTPTAPSRPRLPLPAAARAVAVLTGQIERLATQASTVALSSSVPRSCLILDAYNLAARLDTVRTGAAAAAAAATIPAMSSSSPSSELAAFEMVTLCAAVLDLITTHSTDILPGETLSGIVTAAKVRAQHRRGSKAYPGRLQLFDAVTSHARRLHSGDGGGGREAVNSAALASVFAPCFEAVLASGAQGARVHGGASERLRRKVVAFLESAAGPNGAADTGTIPHHASPAAAPAIEVSSTGLTSGNGRGGFKKNAEVERGARPPEAGADAGTETAAPPLTEPKQHQQQHWQRGLTTPFAGASSGGTVLGIGRSAGSRKRGSRRLDLSSMIGTMSGPSGAGEGKGLPEFENFESLVSE